MKQDFYLQPDGDNEEQTTPPKDTGGQTDPVDDEESEA